MLLTLTFTLTRVRVKSHCAPPSLWLCAFAARSKESVSRQSGTFFTQLKDRMSFSTHRGRRSKSVEASNKNGMGPLINSVIQSISQSLVLFLNLVLPLCSIMYLCSGGVWFGGYWYWCEFGTWKATNKLWWISGHFLSYILWSIIASKSYYCVFKKFVGFLVIKKKFSVRYGATNCELHCCVR